MTDSNDKNNSDSLIITEQTAPTLNDILSPNNSKSIDNIITMKTQNINSDSNTDAAISDSDRGSLPNINIKIN